MSEGKKILLVDDDPSFLNVMVRSFREAGGWEVIAAEDGFQSGSLVGSEEPDVVVLDIMLPDKKGYKICEIIKAHNPDTIVIAMTGYDSEDVRTKMLQAGADAYFVKPFSFQELFSKINTLLAGRGQA